MSTSLLDRLKGITSKAVFPSAQKIDKEYEEKFDSPDEEAKAEAYSDVVINGDLNKVSSSDEESPEASPHDAASKFTGQDIDAILPSTDDDDDLPASTFRMWLLSIVFGAVVSGTDAFFLLRFPKVAISVVVILIVTWPLGCLMHMILPAWQIKLPFGMGFNLNPGPFNYKEHGCIYIFTNLVTSSNIVVNIVVEDMMMFKNNISIGRQILFNFSCYILGFAFCGLTRDVLVTPEERIWPGVLSKIALFKAIYSMDNPVANGWKMSRWVWLVIVFVFSFVWYWVPDFLMPFMSNIGAWISWIKPESHALSQVFGVKTGLGLFPLTFDWAQVASINNPLTTPFWAVASMFGSFVFWIWIVMPGLYYQNHWQTAHFPIMTNKIYTVDKKPYSFQEVVNNHKDWKLDMNKYRNYSPPMLPIAFIMNVCLSIGTLASLVVHFFCMFKEDVIDPFRTRNKGIDRFNRICHRHKPFPLWIYFVFLVIGLGLGFAFCEGFDDAPIRADGFIVAIAITLCLFMPLSLLEARANTLVQLSAFYFIIAANWFKGEPLKLLYFWGFSFGTIQHVMHSSQGAKVGHYLRIKPKIYMAVLLGAAIWSSMVTPAVAGFLCTHRDSLLPGLCTPQAKNNMVCRIQHTQFNTHGIWGLFGSHLFSPGGRYGFVLWFFLVGGLVALVQFVLMKWRGKNSIFAKFDPVLFFGGAENIPSVTGFNYSTWFATAFVFNFIIHRSFTPWWRKYNLVSSIGIDCGVAICIIIVYFSLKYTGASKHFKWWGTHAGTTYWNGKKQVKTCDSKGCAFKDGPVKYPGFW